MNWIWIGLNPHPICRRINWIWIEFVNLWIELDWKFTIRKIINWIWINVQYANSDPQTPLPSSRHHHHLNPIASTNFMHAECIYNALCSDKWSSITSPCNRPITKYARLNVDLRHMQWQQVTALLCISNLILAATILLVFPDQFFSLIKAINSQLCERSEITRHYKQISYIYRWNSGNLIILVCFLYNAGKKAQNDEIFDSKLEGDGSQFPNFPNLW